MSTEHNKTKRRDFLKTASIGAAGVLVAGVNQTQAVQEETDSAWKQGMQINPNIDNLRVVCCHDHSMIKHSPGKWDMQSQNAPVKKDRVYKVLDELAKSLAQKKEAKEAWKTIFQKPANKEWDAAKVAIKLNCISENHPRIAVVGKVCEELMALGVKAKNIVLYDGKHDASKHYPEFVGKGIPKDVVVSKVNDALGGMVETKVPNPYKGSFKCTKAIAKGEIDVLINIAVNKGHKPAYGQTTLTLKNHAGTFDPKPIHKGGNLDYILAFNKSKAILGGTPVRQQLCIVDSIWGMTGGPFGVPNKVVHRLVMGTFSPAVDYLTAKRIREPIMGVTHKHLDRFLSDFGYKDFEKLDLVDVKHPA